MAKKKLEIKATISQLDDLYLSLGAGAPLPIALQRAGISAASYYYWVAIACVVISIKNQEEIEELEEQAKSGVSLQEIRELAESQTKSAKSAVGTFIEPSAESLLQYKNSRKFRKFADQCYKIISECNKKRSDFATSQLVKIAKSTDKKNGINPSGAMWWLERNLPDYFAKPSDKVKEQEQEPTSMPSMKVEFVNPGTTENTERLLNVETEIFKELKSGGDA